ncbi:hypothetical protein ACO0SA_002803 [Hanseniaspora valbyensis]
MEKEDIFKHIAKNSLKQKKIKSDQWLKKIAKNRHIPITRKWNKPVRQLLNSNTSNGKDIKNYYKLIPPYKGFYYPCMKLCDITGLPTVFTNAKMFGIRYYNSEVYEFIENYISAYDVEMYVKLREGTWEK